MHVASYPFDQIQPDMSLSEEPESILDCQERVMRNKVIPFVKILWKNHPEREATGLGMEKTVKDKAKSKPKDQSSQKVNRKVNWSKPKSTQVNPEAKK
ncbi:hypothetical protein Tco_0362166, partial [Tanacetum coccineum]